MEERVGNLVRTPGGIWLGAKVRSELDNYEGYVHELIEDITGMCRVMVQTRSPTQVEKLEDAYIFDIIKLTFLDEGISESISSLRTPKFHLRDKVKDWASLYNGTITSFGFCLSGCILYHVTGSSLTDSGTPPIYVIQEERLELISAYDSPKAIPIEKPPGGPTVRVSRR